MKYFTPAEDAYLIGTYATASAAAQAAHLGRTLSSVTQRRSRLLRSGKLDRTTRAGHRPWTEDEEARLELLLQNGASARRIAKKLGRTVSAIESHMATHGIRARALRRRVWSMAAVARLFDISEATVTTWIERKWLPAAKNGSRQAGYVIGDGAIKRIISLRLTWPAWEPKQLRDAYWRAFAEHTRSQAGGRWLTTAEVAQQFGYSKHSKCYWRQTGKLKGVGMTTYDGRIYYWSADFAGWRLVDRRITREAA